MDKKIFFSQVELEKMEESLKNIELLLENKETTMPISLWSPSVILNESLLIDDNYHENMLTQLDALKETMQDYVKSVQDSRRLDNISSTTSDSSNRILQQYLGVILQSVSEQKDSCVSIQTKLVEIMDMIMKNREDLVNEDQNFLSGFQKHIVDLRNSGEKTKQFIETLNKQNSVLENKIDEINKNIEKTSHNNQSDLINSINLSIAEIKNIQSSMCKIEDEVNKLTIASEEIICSVNDVKPEESVDIQRYQTYKNVFHSLSELIYDDWDKHAQKYSQLDTYRFDNDERRNLPLDINKKIDVHIDIMSYFIQMIFNIKTIMNDVKE